MGSQKFPSFVAVQVNDVMRNAVWVARTGCEFLSDAPFFGSLVPRLPRSGTRTLKLCRRGDLVFFVT